jgi:molybdate transport system substrate-binding protein
MFRKLAAAVVVATMTMQARATESVQLYAAGSLRAALTEIAAAFEAQAGIKVQAKFGPSGTLKDEIAAGARADVFASANMEHPQALASARKSGPVVLFARNRLCALARPGVAVDTATLLDRMLDPTVKLGTSTPRADPSGDYAWEVFRKAERLRPGSFATLERKALKLVGGPDAPSAPAGRTVYGMLIAEGKADLFLTYCTNAMEAKKDVGGAQIIALPDELAVGADYGLTVIANAPPDAYRFAMSILSADGQRVLAKYGFSAPALPQLLRHCGSLVGRSEKREYSAAARRAHIRID